MGEQRPRSGLCARHAGIFCSPETRWRTRDDRESLLRSLGGCGICRGSWLYAAFAEPLAALQAMVRGGRGTKQPGLALVGCDWISRVEMESQRFLVGWSPRADAVDRGDGQRNESDGPVGRAAKHLWRRPFLPP